MPATYIQVNFRLDCIMEANTELMGESFQDYSWIQDFEADFP